MGINKSNSSRGTLSNSAYNVMRILHPAENLAGVAALTAFSARVMTLNTVSSGLGIALADGNYYFAIPTCVSFTAADNASTYTVKIYGRDAFGDLQTENLERTVVTSIVLRGFLAWSMISRIEIQELGATDPAQTVSCGVAYATGSTQTRLPIPLRLTTSQEIARGVILDVGGGTPAVSFEAGKDADISGRLGTSSADTALTTNNAFGWTPNRLAKAGTISVIMSLFSVAPTRPIEIAVALAPGARI